MPIWSRNHRACETTWTTLFALTQLRAPFPSAGEIPMSELTFWVDSASARAVRAESLSQQLDNTFRLLRGARFERGIGRATATSRMRDTLLVESNTVAHLAEECDALYRFFGEPDPEIAAVMDPGAGNGDGTGALSAGDGGAHDNVDAGGVTTDAQDDDRAREDDDA